MGEVASGKRLAGLYVARRHVRVARDQSFDSLAAVLARAPDHPPNAIDKLLAGAWAAANWSPLARAVRTSLARRLPATHA